MIDHDDDYSRCEKCYALVNKYTTPLFGFCFCHRCLDRISKFVGDWTEGKAKIVEVNNACIWCGSKWNLKDNDDGTYICKYCLRDKIKNLERVLYG